jgi:CRISPR-associated protein (TIGR03984 family)
MKFELEDNGLKLTTIISRAEQFNVADMNALQSRIKEHFEKSYVILWLDYNVLLGLWEKGNFVFYNTDSFDFKYIQRIRIFDQKKEIHIWRSGEEWKGRLRIDEDNGEETYLVIAHQLLFGTKGERLNDQFIRLREHRGTELILPLTNFIFDTDSHQKRIFIKTHNYVKTNKIGQATYFDCRFVAFANTSHQEVL